MDLGLELGRRGYVDVECSDSDPEARAGHGSTSRGAGVGLRVVMRGAALAAVAGLLGVVVVRSAPRHGTGRTSAGAAPAAAPSATMELVGLDGPTSDSLKPLELLHDGNVCDATEELFGGLCYKRCELLTEGQAPIRTSSWTCCKSHPCTPFNEMGSVGSAPVCKGYDVGGDGSCPHKPGACLVDEELHLGVCYKKCNLLTEGAFPNRVGPATCCKTKGLGCLNFKNDKTDQAFDVGGGQGASDAATLEAAHLPEKSLTEESAPGAALPATTPAPSAAQAVAAPAPVPETLGQLKPEEHLNDGNVCADDEELFGGLCYGKCAVLTKGEAPIRTSSWTCCEEHPCGLWNQRGSMGTSILCNGYDVSADGSCPHKPGACLVDEELHLGVCYEKCSLLTDGDFPHRIAAATCCKVKGLGCLNLMNVKTSDAFDKGGGAGDHDAATPADAHSPSESLTEQEDASEPSTPKHGGVDSAAASSQAKASSMQETARTTSLARSSAGEDKADGGTTNSREEDEEARSGASQAGQQPARGSFASSGAVASVERKLRSKLI